MTTFLKIIGLIIFIYVLISGYLYFAQDNLIFPRFNVPKDDINVIKKTYPDIQEVNLTTSDDVELQGWFLKNTESAKSPLLIYFGGNAEQISAFIPSAKEIKNWSVLMLNYRGYGHSEGTPSEKNLFADSLLIYDTFTAREDIDKENVVVLGRSLGTGVAMNLATKRNFKALILASPYDSIARLAQDQYPYVPVNLLIKHPFYSIKLTPQITLPTLVLLAENDNVVPFESSKTLLENWDVGEKTVKQIEDTDHNSLIEHADYIESIVEFLESVYKNDSG